MRQIYFDYTGAIGNVRVKNHGGGNYAKNLIDQYLKSTPENERIKILWPKGYSPQDGVERRIYASGRCEIIEARNILDFDCFDEGCILVIPLIKIRNWNLLKEIKKRVKDIEIYITIHGFRQDDLQFDGYNRYYYDSFLKYARGESLRIMKSFFTPGYAKRYLPYADRIFTVSNYSMQAIIKKNKVNFIKPYIPGILKRAESEKLNDRRHYLLFVSANRPEKNFIRALEAFVRYKEKTDNDIYLYVTGIHGAVKDNILKKEQEKLPIIDRWVKFFDYVGDDELSYYYSNCLFLLYTSKSEGFGLPVLEAACHKKTSVASRVTSIPEVAGPLVYYVDPYDTASIEHGIEYMCDRENRERYETMIDASYESIQSLVETNMRMLIMDIRH